MFVRALFISGALLSLAPAALADTDTATIQLLHQQLQNDFLSNASRLQYGYQAYGDQFSSRMSWLDLRLRPSGTSIRSTGTRLITARRAATIQSPVYRTTARVGGLGRQISGGAPSVSLRGITSGGGSANAPSFGNLHEGSSSSGGFSFGGTSPGAQ